MDLFQCRMWWYVVPASCRRCRRCSFQAATPKSVGAGVEPAFWWVGTKALLLRQLSMEPGFWFMWQPKEQALAPQTDNCQLTLEQAVQRLRQVGILVGQRDQQQ